MVLSLYSLFMFLNIVKYRNYVVPLRYRHSLSAAQREPHGKRSVFRLQVIITNLLFYMNKNPNNDTNYFLHQSSYHCSGLSSAGILISQLHYFANTCFNSSLSLLNQKFINLFAPSKSCSFA